MRVSVRAGSHRIARSLLTVSAISAITLAASPVPSQWALSIPFAVRPATPADPPVDEASS
jgi:hypothetical protein